MKYVVFDFESASACDLLKSGAWKYAEDFSTFLTHVGFKVVEDGLPKPTRVLWGLTLNRVDPELLSLASDPKVMFLAHNCGFEQPMWKQHMVPLGYPEIPIERWHDSMAVAAMKSLPLGLDPLTQALDLPIRKDMEGHRLMLQFCKPDKDGGWSHHTVDKAKRIAEYNVGDVDSQHAVYVATGGLGMERPVWEADQRINQRGVLVDTKFVRACQDVLEQVRVPMTKEFKELTGGISPTQREKILNWVNEQGVRMSDMRKATLDAMLDPDDNIGFEDLDQLGIDPLPPHVHKVLTLRRSLASSSVAKLDRMLQCACRDGRVRYSMQYHGAGTGRFCLTGDHEVLTRRNGWQRLDQWGGGEIAVWNPAVELVSFQKSESLNFDYTGPMIRHEAKRIDQIATPDHKMPTYGAHSGLFEPKLVKDLPKKYQIPLYGSRATAFPLDDAALRVLIMVQADGSYPAESGVRLTFRKKRKVERCKTLLRRAEIPFRLRVQEASEENAKPEHQQIYTFTIPERHLPLYLHMFRDKTFGPWLLDVNPTVFFDEVVHWDGYHSGPNSKCYVSTNKQNIDMVQALAHISGRVAFCRDHHTNHAVWKNSWVLNIWENCTNRVEVKPEVTSLWHEGQVYCASTPTGYFLVRRNGRVWVTGNSGRLIQIQNYPRGEIQERQGLTPEILADAILTRNLDRITDLWGPDIFSAVISSLRSCIVPDVSKGRTLVVGDYAQVEARNVLSFAGHHDKASQFDVVDQYSELGAMIFKHPVNKKDNPRERQTGKNALLGSGFGLGPAGFQAKFAPNEPFSLAELAINTYRKEYAPLVPRFWHGLYQASVDAVWCSRALTYVYEGIEFRREGEFLTMRLPSGRKIYYHKPQRETSYNPSNGREYPSWSYVSYQGKKNRRNSMWYGQLMNNLVQGSARDLVVNAIFTCEREGLPVVFTAHDEIVCETKDRDGLAVMLKQIMEDIPVWARERRFNVKAETDVMMRYRK